MRTTLLSLIAVVSLALAGGCSKKLDTAGVEKTIKDQLKEMGVEVTKISCPRDVKAEAGKTFDCSVEAGDKKATLTITMEKVEGDKVYYKPDYTDLASLVGGATGGGGEEAGGGGEEAQPEGEGEGEKTE